MTGEPALDELATPLGAGLILLGPAGSRRLLAALRAVDELARREGVGVHPDVLRLQAMAEVAVERARSFVGETGRETAGVSPNTDTASLRLTPSLGLVDPVSCAEAASLLRCSPQWVRTLCRRRVFPSAQRRAGSWWIERIEVVALPTRAQRRHRSP